MKFSPFLTTRRSTSWSSALVLCALASAFLASNARAADPDLSTPKKAGVAFVKAMEVGDIAAMKLTATGTDEQFEALKNLGDMMGALKKYEAAAVKKFGDAGKLPGDAKLDLAAEVEKTDEKIDGDKATLTDKAKPDEKHPMTLKKDGGNWKVDLKEVDPKMIEAAPKAKKAAAAIDTVIKGIEGDKYKTAIEALTALGEIMQTLN